MTPRRKRDYMRASFASKGAKGDWLFSLASQRDRIVDTDRNMGGGRKSQKHTMKVTGKLTL